MKTTFLLLLSLVLLCPAPGRAQTYQQVWADEFTNGIGPGWQFETGAGGWGNNEKQYYQRANATVVNGELQITARRENVGGAAYTSARMKTQGLKQFTYGRMEARIKMPLGQGLWPGFWMLGSNISSVSWPACGEIDIMEHINAENKVYGTAHWDSNGHAEYGGNTVTSPQDYHVYSVEWEPTYIRWFVDGTQYHEMSIANNVGGTEEFQRPFFLLLNLAVAGNWPGQTVDDGKLPATMSVDYVRVYQRSTAPSATGVATVYRDCNYGGTGVSLPVGEYSLSALQSRGVVNDDLSSLRVSSGYRVVLYADDNFGGASLTLTADNGCLTGNGLGGATWNDQASSLRVQAAPAAFSRQLEAEAHSVNSGMVVEACSEGGQDMGYVDAGDYLVWNAISFPTAGSYRLDYRVASGGSGGTISADLNGGSVQLGSTSIPATGGWQSWRTVSRTVSVSAGTYNFGIYAQSGGWNLNWVRITKLEGVSAAAASASATAAGAESAASAPQAGGLTLYPNPVTDQLHLAAAETLAGSHYQIVDGRGRTLGQGTTTEEGVDVANLAPGVYVLRLTRAGQAPIVRRFVK